MMFVCVGECFDDGVCVMYVFDYMFEVEVMVCRVGKMGYKEKILMLYVLVLFEDVMCGCEVMVAKVGVCDVDLVKYVDCMEDEMIMIDVECGEGV